MTLLDAPSYDPVARQKRLRIIYSAISVAFCLLVGWWLVAGMPMDWPWTWASYQRGVATTNHFFAALEKNDQAQAYGIWINDPEWQKHPKQTGSYPFDRFQQDWGPTGEGNDYGIFQSHKIIARRMYGDYKHETLIVAVAINGRKSKYLFLSYDPREHTLGFSPVELYLGP